MIIISWFFLYIVISISFNPFNRRVKIAAAAGPCDRAALLSLSVTSRRPHRLTNIYTWHSVAFRLLTTHVRSYRRRKENVNKYKTSPRRTHITQSFMMNVTATWCQGSVTPFATDMADKIIARCRPRTFKCAGQHTVSVQLKLIINKHLLRKRTRRHDGCMAYRPLRVDRLDECPYYQCVPVNHHIWCPCGITRNSNILEICRTMAV